MTTKNTFAIALITLAAVLLTSCLLPHISYDEVQTIAVCIDKNITQNRGGENLHYHIVYRLKDGSLQFDDHTIPEHYYSVEVGKTYLLTDYQFNWK